MLVRSNRKMLHRNVKEIKIILNLKIKSDNIKIQKLPNILPRSRLQIFCRVCYLTSNIPNKRGKHLKVGCMLSPEVVKLIREMCRLLIHLIMCFYLKCKISLLGLLPKGVLLIHHLFHSQRVDHCKWLYWPVAWFSIICSSEPSNKQLLSAGEKSPWKIQGLNQRSLCCQALWAVTDFWISLFDRYDF